MKGISATSDLRTRTNAMRSTKAALPSSIWISRPLYQSIHGSDARDRNSSCTWPPGAEKAPCIVQSVGLQIGLQ